MRGPTAVDGEDGARNRGGSIAAEEYDQIGKLLDLNELLRRLRGEHDVSHDFLFADATSLGGIRDLTSNQWCLDVAGSNRIDRNVLVRKLERDDFRQAGNTVFCGNIGGLEG